MLSTNCYMYILPNLIQPKEVECFGVYIRIELL